MFLIVVWIHAQVVEGEFFSYSLLERRPFLQSQAITLGNDWHDVDKLGELLQHDNVDWLQAMAGRLNEEEAAVNASVLQISLTLSSKLLAQISTVLIFDVFDDWIPAALIVHQITVSRSINNVQAQTHAIFLDDV